MKLFVCGDVHADMDYRKLKHFRKIMKYSLTRDDYLVVCGDFGVIWDGGSHDRYFLNTVYKDFPCTILWVDGNHENFDVLGQYPITEWNDGKVQVISDTIIHLMRGEVYHLNGVKIFSLGGAMSTDRGYDTGFNIAWWPQELPSDEELNNAVMNLAKVDNTVDYIFTHDGPGHVLREQFCINRASNQKFSIFLDSIANGVKFRHWFFGHHHEDKTCGNFTCLYDNIVDLEV